MPDSTDPTPFALTREQYSAVTDVLSVLGEWGGPGDPPSHFTCSEAEAFASFVEAFHSEAAAEAFRLAHAHSDEQEEDEHHDLYLTLI